MYSVEGTVLRHLSGPKVRVYKMRPKKKGDNAVVIKGATKARVRALAIEITEIE